MASPLPHFADQNYNLGHIFRFTDALQRYPPWTCYCSTRNQQKQIASLMAPKELLLAQSLEKFVPILFVYFFDGLKLAYFCWVPYNKILVFLFIMYIIKLRSWFYLKRTLNVTKKDPKEFQSLNINTRESFFCFKIQINPSILFCCGYNFW